jgi:hypothetical protein
MRTDQHLFDNFPPAHRLVNTETGPLNREPVASPLQIRETVSAQDGACCKAPYSTFRRELKSHLLRVSEGQDAILLLPDQLTKAERDSIVGYLDDLLLFSKETS